MSVEKLREEFEAAFVEEMVVRCGEGYRSSVEFFFVEKEPDGTYSNPIAHAGWWGWQASRAALVIELPQQSGVNLDWNQAIRYCHQAIEAVGVKVKP